MTTRRTALASLLACTVVGATRTFASDGRERGMLTATDVHPKDYPTVVAVRWIGEQLARETGGRLHIRTYHAGQLGRESDTIELARRGAIDFTRVYTGALNNAFPLTTALCMPFAFTSVAHQRRVLDGAVGREVLAGFARRGLVGLALYDSGPRCFYNTRGPLYRPDDLKGLKLRVPPSDSFIALVRALGGNATPLAFGQVFTSLETRLIDGAENNLRSFHASRHFEAARYWSNTKHSYAPDALLLSARTWQGLAPRERDLVQDLARASVGVMRREWDASEAKARLALVEAGVQFNDVDDDAFRRAADPVIRALLADPAIRALSARIRAEEG